MRKPTEIEIWIILIMAFLMLVSVLFWLIYPYNVIEYKNDPFKTEETVIKRGEHIHFNIEYCKYINVGTTLTRSFEDGLVYSTPEIENNFDVGCANKRIAVYVPKAIPVGKYKIKHIFRFKVNPIRQMEYIKYTTEFEVIN